MKGRDRVRKKYLLAPFCLGAMVSFAFAKPATVHADNEFDLNVESNDSLFSLKNSFNFSYNNQKAVSANKEEALLKRLKFRVSVFKKHLRYFGNGFIETNIRIIHRHLNNCKIDLVCRLEKRII